MKIKKFKNLWLMGIIIMCVLLVGFELLKIINPHFIIDIAEIPEVVKFGTYVQIHEWAYYIFTFITNFVTYWLICCACCRKKCLNWKECLIVSSAIIILFICQKFFIEYYSSLNILSLLLLPILFCIMNNTTDKKHFISILVVLVIDLIFQILSLQIRNLALMLNYPNIIAITILYIDTYIWEVLLYNYFNYKGDK